MSALRRPRVRVASKLPEVALRGRLRDLRQRPAPVERIRAVRMSDWWFAVFVGAWGFSIAVLTLAQEWQLLATLVFTSAIGMLYSRWPAIGAMSLLTLWCFAPLLRRILDVAAPSSLGPDILSITPFMATFVCAVIGFRQYRPPNQVVIAVGVVCLGFGIGVPLGLAAPFAVMFALFAYVAGVLAVFIGYSNARQGIRSLESILLWMVLLTSIYGVWQGIIPHLAIWDQAFLIKSKFVSVGSKELHNFRIFSTLNSPYTYASLVAVWLAMLFVSRKVTVLRVLVVLIAVPGIFLTQSRGAWVSVVGGLVLITFFTGGRALPRLFGLVLLLAGMYFALGSTPAGQAVVSRASSIGQGANDVSGQSRLQALTTLGPPALTQPLGHGLGSVGAASDLNPTPFVSLVDNGFLIVLIQVGPIGFLLIGFGILYLIRYVLKGTTVATRAPLLASLAPIGVFIPLSVFSETLYGLTGFILFYALGEALGIRHRQRLLAGPDPGEIAPPLAPVLTERVPDPEPELETV